MVAVNHEILMRRYRSSVDWRSRRIDDVAPVRY